MALMITDDCILCGVCEAECLNGAISFGESYHEISSNLCTECVGYADSPQCVEVCPLNCIVVNPNHRESAAELHLKHLIISASS
ncbi:MAG TPA: YfhL family 4Fe-4S dicluster ferredoxin [Methylotenera sp.]|nr:YfhL family 4Fe-4S dicluster ferredoxin [Methylotenera sp.]HPN02054.1 YfhL family 4Fe-4S dicluster ferredoxin [Methylotenera sp.]